MCRFVAYLGGPVRLHELLLKPDHSIIRQSYQAREGREPLNGDGFGVGWYHPELDPEPALYRNVRPAWSDGNMAHIAPRIETPAFFAHVRAASPGLPVHHYNCHPFVHGRLMFMHNGQVGSYKRVMRKLREGLSDRVYDTISGSTDSEHAFAAVLEALGDVEDPSLDDLAKAMVNGVSRLEELKREVGNPEDKTLANMALTDGRSMVVLRYASPEGIEPATLYLGRARAFTTNEDGVCVAVDPGETGAVLISSEALWQEQTTWTRVPENHLVRVGPDLTAQVEDVGVL